MSFTLVTVTGSFIRADGITPSQGEVLFRLTSPLYDPSTQTSVSNDYQRAVMDDNGDISIVLTALDDVGITPQGAQYEVTEHHSFGRTFQYFIEITTADAPTVDLATLVQETGTLTDLGSSITSAVASKVAKAGDIMTGLLTLSGDPSTSLQAAPKQYVDAAKAAAIAASQPADADLSAVAANGATATGLAVLGAASQAAARSAIAAQEAGTSVAIASDASRNTKGAGSSALGALTSGTDNTALGYQALAANTSGSFNVAIGVQALVSNTTGGTTDEFSNVAIGAHAMHDNTTGGTNLAIGGSALYKNTTGSDNIAVGGMALEVNVDGNWNTALGASALNYFQHSSGQTAIGFAALSGPTNQALTTGNYNTAVGFKAGNAATSTSNCTLVGANAGLVLTSGGEATAVGSTALGAATTGSGNTAIGDRAGHTPNAVVANATVTGQYNTFVGRLTGAGNTSDPSYTTAIGANATVIGNGSVAIGCDNTGAGAAATTANQIVLGTALHTLKVPGASGTIGELFLGDTGFGSGYTGLKYIGLTANQYGLICDSNGNTFLNAGNGAVVTHRINNVTQMTMAAGSLTLLDAFNLALGTATGSKIGTATTQKLGFWNATPVVQQARPTTLGDVIALGTLIGLWA